ncbi:hypothetical protein ACVGXX_00140, partial [Enterobacter intestinihominis]
DPSPSTQPGNSYPLIAVTPLRTAKGFSPAHPPPPPNGKKTHQKFWKKNQKTKKNKKTHIIKNIKKIYKHPKAEVCNIYKKTTPPQQYWHIVLWGVR